MNLVETVFWLFLPAAVANMVPILFSKMPVFDTPVDFGKKYHGQAIVGPHKTYRGFIVGVAAAVLVVYLQKKLFFHTLNLAYINYPQINVLKLGFLLGFGALFGDLLKSFIKRRLGKKSGSPWPPYDQIDWVIGAVVFVGFYIPLESKQVVVALIMFGLLHPLASLVGYKLGLKKNKF